MFVEKNPTKRELDDFYSSYAYSEGQFFSEVTRKRYNELLDQFEPYRKKNTILDIGCGSGFFLETALARGWEVYGTEYSSAAVSLCQNKGMNVSLGALEEAFFKEENFDVITSFEVIEHINNPLHEMKLIERILRKGGLFYCTTPNFNSISRHVLRAAWDVIHYPEHLSFYTDRSFDYLMRSVGLKKLTILTTGISLTRFRRSMGLKDEIMTESSSDEKFREKAESNGAFGLMKRIVNYVLNGFRFGDALKAKYEKPN
ncbi:MAG: class I SAM-dependent methyltransferase [Cyclobacteriaceae bacterium]